MLDLNPGLDSPSRVPRNPSDLIRQLQQAGDPIILSINGKADLVVRDTVSYRSLLELAERAERIEALREAIADIKAGRGIPAEEMLAEMRQILAEKQGR